MPQVRLEQVPYTPVWVLRPALADWPSGRAVVGKISFHRFHRPADGFPCRGRDLIHRSVDERIGRGAVLLVVFQIGMDGHRLCLPRLLGGAGAEKAANGAKLRVGNAHKTVHKVQRDIALQAFSLMLR